jgi:membrane protein DedA with SNARE-associated domain
MIFAGGFFSAIGSTLGASIGYWVARLGGRPLIDKFARFVRISPTHITHTENQFQHWGTGLVLVGRVIPGVRTMINIPAGLARMPFFTFLIATFIGAFIWCTMLIGAGYILGHEWSLIGHYMKKYFPYLAAIGIAAYLGYLLVRRSVLNRSTFNLEQL